MTRGVTLNLNPNPHLNPDSDWRPDLNTYTISDEEGDQRSDNERDEDPDRQLQATFKTLDELCWKCRGSNVIVFNVFSIPALHIANYLQIPSLCLSPCLPPAITNKQKRMIKKNYLDFLKKIRIPPADMRKTPTRQEVTETIDALHHWAGAAVSPHYFEWRDKDILNTKSFGYWEVPRLVYGISNHVIHRPKDWPTATFKSKHNRKYLLKVPFYPPVFSCRCLSVIPIPTLTQTAFSGGS